MRQQINLYQPIASDERTPLASRTMGIVAGGVVTVLLVIWGFGMRQVARLEVAVAALRTQQANQEQSMNTVGAMRPANVNPAQLQAQVKELTAQVTARAQALEILRKGGAGQKGGFAARMEALARQHTDGLWIDRIVLSGTSGAMAVSGSTLNPDLVPVYLRALAGESALTGTRFDQLTIERHTKAIEPADDEPDAKPVAVSKGIRFRAESNSLRVTNTEKPS
jgi:Tfp pilus assembly protein PilN